MLQGVYEGDVDLKTLAAHGDMGLGTFNQVDGEMVALDGNFYRADEHGVVRPADPAARTPFSVVATARPSISFAVQNLPDFGSLTAAIDAHLPTANIFYMIRVDAELEWVSFRSEGCQEGPPQPFSETLPKLQRRFELSHLQGSLIGTHCPAYSGGVTIPGYHFHFVNQARDRGGHVFDLRIASARVMITAMRRFSLLLIDSPAFDTANLDMDSDDVLRKTE